MLLNAKCKLVGDGNVDGDSDDKELKLIVKVKYSKKSQPFNNMGVKKKAEKRDEIKDERETYISLLRWRHWVSE